MAAVETEEAFAYRTAKKITDGYVTLCLAMGHKLGLFDHLNETPQTSQQIATSSGFRERYVREWLNSMVVSDIVDVDDSGLLYSLKQHRRNVLTGGSPYLVGASMMPMFASVFDQIAECFHSEGPRGVPYSAYKGFHQLMSSDSDRTFNTNLISSFIPAIPGLVEKLNVGITCLDVGCGHGTPSCLLGKRFPKSTFIGIDFSSSAIEFATNRAKEENLTNVQFFAHDANKLPDEWSNRFGYVTAFDAIHDQAYPENVLREIYRVIQSGGLFSMVDVNAHSNVAMNKSLPGGPEFIYTASLFHCMPVSLYFENGTGLGTAWGKEMAGKMLDEVGFKGMDFSLAGTSEFNYHCLCTKP